MKHTVFALVLALLAGASGSALAIEASANAGPQAAQSAVTSMNNTFNGQLAGLQAQISSTLFCNSNHKFYAPADPSKDANGCVGATDSTTLVCNANRKFYSPTDPKKDTNGCVGVDDYSLNMKTGNVLTTANGQITAATPGAGTWAGVFNGTYGVYGSGQAGHGVEGDSVSGYGVVGQSANSIGVYGSSTSNWAGYFTASPTGYGVLGMVNGGYPVSGHWAGEFYGGAGVWIGNANGSGAQLCLNGTCTTTVAGAAGRPWYGAYEINANSGGCTVANGFTGACSCPAGFGAMVAHSANDRTGTWYNMYNCYQ